MTQPEGVLDPRLAREMIAGTEAAVRAQLKFDAARVYLAWGLAWLIGYCAVGLGARPDAPPAPWSFAVLGVVMTAAMAVTIWSIVRASRGVRGKSSVIGRLLGLSWWAGFVGMYGFLGALTHRISLSDDVAGVLWAVAPALVVGILYVAQGAAGADGTQSVLGAWICLVCASVGFAPVPWVAWLIGVLAGGGFLVASWRERGRSRAEARRAH